MTKPKLTLLAAVATLALAAPAGAAEANKMATICKTYWCAYDPANHI